jgi:hypothetical protein
MTRTGKIARLPHSIREELNRRLADGIHGATLLSWLNSLPEVQAILTAHFRGKPVSKQNLSEWRHGGFSEWQSCRDFHARLHKFAAAAEKIEETGGPMADHAARLLSVRIAMILTDWDGNPASPAFAQLKHLSALIRDIARLRHGDHSAARLKLRQQARSCQPASSLVKPSQTAPALSSSPPVHPIFPILPLPPILPVPHRQIHGALKIDALSRNSHSPRHPFAREAPAPL